LNAGSFLYFGREEAFGGSNIGGDDWGYITYDNNSTKYGSGGGETSAFRFGTSNDAGGAVSDAMALEPVAELYLNPGSGIKVGNYSSNWTMSVVGASGIGIDLAATDVYASFRVFRNNNTSGGFADGMYIGYGNGNSGLTRIYGGGSTSAGMVRYATYTQHDDSDRAPIFYDSDNTTYYIDPASSTTSFYMNGGMITTAPGGTVLMRHLVSETDAWLFMENAANWGLYWKNNPTGNHTFGGYTSIGAEMFGMSAVNSSGNGVATTNFVGATAAVAQWMLSNYTGYIWSASTIFAAGDMRSPIFYDSNNTAYYFDGASTAANAMTVAGGIHVSVGNVTGQGIILADDGDIVDLNDGYCAMRFSNGVRVHSGNRTGGAVVALTSGGAVIASGDITAYGSPSDINLKENIENIPNALEKLLTLNGVNFNYKKDGSRSTGVIAQEVEKVLPEVIYNATNPEGTEHFKAVRYGNMVGLLIEAIKEQQTHINRLEQKINSLENK
jgi:hypothetical protein